MIQNELKKAMLAMGIPKAATESRLNLISEEDQQTLYKMLADSNFELPANFEIEFRKAVAEGEKRLRGVNKAVPVKVNSDGNQVTENQITEIEVEDATNR